MTQARQYFTEADLRSVWALEPFHHIHTATLHTHMYGKVVSAQQIERRGASRQTEPRLIIVQ